MQPGTVCLVLEPSDPARSWYGGILEECATTILGKKLYTVLPLLKLRSGELIRSCDNVDRHCWEIIPESRLVPVYTPESLAAFKNEKNEVALVDFFDKKSRLLRLAILEYIGLDYTLGVCNDNPENEEIIIDYDLPPNQFLIFPHYLPDQNVKILEFDSETISRGDIVFDFNFNEDLLVPILRFGRAFDSVTAEIPYGSRARYLNLVEKGRIGEKDPERLARVVLSQIDPSKLEQIPKIRTRKVNPNYGTW